MNTVFNERQAVCGWFIEDPDYGVWESDCGMEFMFNDDGPIENNFKYCPGCGKPITVLPSQ